MTKEFPMLPLFNQFVRDSFNGKRLKPNGQKIRTGTAENYRCAYLLLKEYEEISCIQLRVRTASKMTVAEKKTEYKYWKKFYFQFSRFLYRIKKCFDSYQGQIMKLLRSFFKHLARDKHLDIGEFYKILYVRKEEVEIIALSPEQLSFLINDHNFHLALPAHLRRTKEIFSFGCTVALRYSDIFNIRVRDVSQVNGFWYLFVKCLKTGTPVRIKLSDFAVGVFRRFKQKNRGSNFLFKSICLRQFNKNLQAIGESAGWITEVGKLRSMDGKVIEKYRVAGTKCSYRFCDLLSSHIMRKTAITGIL